MVGSSDRRSGILRSADHHQRRLSTILAILRVGERWTRIEIKGAAEQAKGAVKEAAGKVTGDAKLEAEGKADKAAGKVRNAGGGLKDLLRGK